MRKLIFAALVAIPFAANAGGYAVGWGSADSYSTSGTGAVSTVLGNGIAIQQSDAGALNSSGVDVYARHGYGGSSLDLDTYSVGGSYANSFGIEYGYAFGATSGSAYEGGSAGAYGYVFDY